MKPEDDQDDSVPTPAYAVDPVLEVNPNPAPEDQHNQWHDGPVAGDVVYADGAVNARGELLKADGSVAGPKGGQ